MIKVVWQCLFIVLLTSGVSLSAEKPLPISTGNKDFAFVEASNLVTRAYSEILGRAPDSRGLATYIQYLEEGKSEDWLRAELRKSPEFRGRATAQRLHHLKTGCILILAFCLSCLIFFVSRNYRAVKISVVVTAGICCIFYFYCISRYAVNIPSWDDFDSILAYLNNPLSMRLQRIFSLHNEHRIVFTRVLAELSALFCGNVDFKFMTIVMNASLVGILYIFRREWRSNGLPWCYFALLPFLILSTQPWVNMMHPIQYAAAYLMTITAIHLVQSNKLSHLILTVLLAVFSTYTTASGIFTFPVLAVGVFLYANRRERDEIHITAEKPTMFLKMTVILSCMAGIAWLYFHNYQTPLHHARAFGLLKEPLFLLQYFACLLGALFGTPAYAAAAGVFILLFLGGVTIKIMRKDGIGGSHTFYLTLLFLTLNCAVITIGRSGLDIPALDHRYRLLSLLIVCSCMGCALQYWPVFFRHGLVFILLGTFVIAGYIFSAINAVGRFEQHRKILIVETVNWMERRHGLHYPREGMEHAGEIFDESIRRSIYIPPVCVERILEEKKQTTKPGLL